MGRVREQFFYKTAAMEKTRIMNTKSLAIASILAASLATAAHAQTLTVVGSEAPTGSSFTYSYVVTPTFNVNQLIFNFSDTNFTSETSNGPLTFQAGPSIPTAGEFFFGNGTLAANTSETFTFVSPDAPGGTLGTVGISFAGSSVASVNGTMPAPAAAPEPGGMVALAVMFGCLAVGVAAKRRNAAACAL